MMWLAITWVVLNVIDAASTLLSIHYLGATELNPLMASSISAGPIYFLIIKFAVVGFVIWLLNRIPIVHSRRILWYSVGLYGALACWHVMWWTIALNA